MYLAQIFHASPLMGLALCICLATILWCFLMARRQQSGLDKVLTGLLGLIATYEAIRVLKDAGVLIFPGMQRLDGVLPLGHRPTVHSVVIHRLLA